MQLMRSGRALVPLMTLGLVGFVSGCSGQQDSPPVDKAAEKSITEAIRSARQEEKAERAQLKGGPIGKGRGPGRSGP